MGVTIEGDDLGPVLRESSLKSKDLKVKKGPAIGQATGVFLVEETACVKATRWERTQWI